MFHFGFLYIGKNTIKAFKCFKKSAKQGNYKSMAYYSYFLRYLWCGEKEVEKSNVWGQKVLGK